LIWLLVLAIPAQGAAAATMAFCGPKHQGGVAADQVAAAGHVHGGLEATAAHEHPRAGANGLVADEVDVAAEVQAVSPDQHKCSLCGSCCSTGALMGAVPTLHVVDFAPTAFLLVVASVDPYAADGPDRPPRNLLV
jgi:hypothetical protein